jgi:hypothetical protein
MRVLFIGTYPDQPIGYSKIANKLSNYIADLPEVTVYFFGLFNLDPSRLSTRYIHPSIIFIDATKRERMKDPESKELYGVNVIVDVVNEIKPDIIFCYNDLVVSSRMINSLIAIPKTFKFYVYLDLIYDYEKPAFLIHVMRYSDKVIVFSDYWKRHLTSIGILDNKIHVLPHGYDKVITTPLSTSECKKLLNIPETNFVILNANRNHYRKANDITISAFLLFLKAQSIQEDGLIVDVDQNVKLFLYCEMDNHAGYDIASIVTAECLKHKLNPDYILKNHIIRLTDINVEDKIINLLYNACDVGINTCIGEGFGLCNLEHAILGKPQVVSNICAFQDIFAGMPDSVVNPASSFQVANHTDLVNGVARVCNPEDFADKLSGIYRAWKDKTIRKDYGSHLKSKYDWDNILPLLRTIIME